MCESPTSGTSAIFPKPCISHAEISRAKSKALVPRDAKVIVYCARANRSALAADTMQVMGYTDVMSLAGGWADWMSVDGPVEG